MVNYTNIQCLKQFRVPGEALPEESGYPATNVYSYIVLYQYC